MFLSIAVYFSYFIPLPKQDDDPISDHIAEQAEFPGTFNIDCPLFTNGMSF